MAGAKIAVLSGKGGTGKTLLSVNFASLRKNSIYVDCDIEEPNGHLFFKPKIISEEIISVKIPVVNQEECDGCRKCVDFCMFNALAYIKNNLVVFDNICHSCGGCALLCPQKAISEVDKQIGRISIGKSGNVGVYSGLLNTGESSGVPIVSSILKKVENIENTVFIDAPPGSACIVMESIKDVDFCVLVTEPTIFGLHNLKMVYELVKVFKKKAAVVINKSQDNSIIEEYCKEENINIIGKIPYDKEIALLNSNGLIIVNEKEKFRNMFSEILDRIEEEVNLWKNY